MTYINNRPVAQTADSVLQPIGKVVQEAKYLTDFGGGRSKRVDARLAAGSRYSGRTDTLKFATIPTETLVSLAKGLILRCPDLMLARNDVLAIEIIHQLLEGADVARTPLQADNAAEFIFQHAPIQRIYQAISIAKNRDGDVEHEHNASWWKWKLGVEDIHSQAQREEASRQLVYNRWLAMAGAVITMKDTANNQKKAYSLDVPELEVVTKSRNGQLRSAVLDNLKTRVKHARK